MSLAVDFFQIFVILQLGFHFDIREVFMAEHGESSKFPAVATEKEIREVMEIVGEVVKAERPLLPKTAFEYRMEIIQRWLFSHSLLASLIMFATAWLAFYLKSKPWAETTIALAIISQALYVSMLGTGVIGAVPFVWNLFRRPHEPFLSLVSSSSEMDLKYVFRFDRCSEEALRYAIVQCQLQRNDSSRRVGMIAGAIDKVGIFPALAALVVLVTNLLKTPGSIPWAAFFGPLLFAFNLLSLWASELTQKQDRAIALLEYSLQRRK